MRIVIENNEPTFVGLSLELLAKDVDRLISQLTKLKTQPDQHFHLSTEGTGAFVDIAVCMQTPDANSNSYGTGFTISADD